MVVGNSVWEAWRRPNLPPGRPADKKEKPPAASLTYQKTKPSLTSGFRFKVV